MLKWIVTLVVALAVLSAFAPWLARHGLWRLPGDITVRVRGRDYYLPFTTTLILSAVLTLLARFI